MSGDFGVPFAQKSHIVDTAHSESSQALCTNVLVVLSVWKASLGGGFIQLFCVESFPKPSLFLRTNWYKLSRS